MSQFLPKEAENATCPVTRSATDSFVTETAGFIQDVAKNMSVNAVNDVGRIPSLLSRAYSFYLDLFPGELAAAAENREGRAEARKRARREFRGITAVLALRATLDIDVRLVKFNPRDGSIARTERFREVFDGLYSGAPGFDDHEAWPDFRYLIIRSTPQGGPPVEEPLCGLSPYTLIYPAAHCLQACRSIFWYDSNIDSDNYRWWDPTTDWSNHEAPLGMPLISYDVIKRLRGFVRKWLDRTVAQPNLQQIWQQYGLTVTRADSLKKELEEWRKDLGRLEATPTPNTIELDKAGLDLKIKDPNGIDIIVPILEQKITAQEGRIVSELPRIGGRILLSESIVTDEKVRICGNLMGGPALKGCLKELETEGAEFTLSVNAAQYRIREPYVVVDKLFLDKIHLLADGSLSRNFFALDTTGTAGEEEHWMFPFRPEMLRYLELDKLCSGQPQERTTQVSATRVSTDGNDVIRVDLQIGGWRFSRSYSGDENAAERNRDTAGNALDLRIWPNFRFPISPRTPNKDVDRIYYFRIRQQPVWRLRTQILARQVSPENAEQFGSRQEAGRSPSGSHAEITSFLPDSRIVGWQTEFERFRLAQCFVFSCTSPIRADDGAIASGDWEPVGVYFENRGICLFRLGDAQLPGGPEPTKWRVGVDFGTSNTCVTFIPLKQGEIVEGEPLRFEMLTATLHDPPKYEEVLGNRPDEGNETEGAAAVLDFPYKYEKVAYLTDKSHFPSILVTRQATAPQDANFRMANGLIFPRNVILDNKDIGGLLKDYPLVPYPSPDRRLFRLITEVKWANERYRKTFLWHLYKMITYEAALRGSVMTEAAFSFPRAFDRDKINSYQNEIRAIFCNHGAISVSENDFLTESETVHRWFVANPDRRDHLVMDVGGGTTDYLAVFGDRALVQASYCFAASYVNDYFAASPFLVQSLNKAIENAVEEKSVAMEERNIQNQRSRLKRIIEWLGQVPPESLPQFKSYCHQAFFGMLGMMEDRHYGLVVGKLLQIDPGNQAAAAQRAICGFFHTLVLLYTGMVYEAGVLLRQKGLSSTDLQIDFIGNGSRFYRFLHNDSTSFNKVLQNIFQGGIGTNTKVRPQVDPEGKTLVALGLLITKVENDARFTDAPIVPDESSMKYLRVLATQEAPPRSFEYHDLAHFLELLNQQLPGGRLDGKTVIPYAENNLHNELTGLFEKMQEAVRRAERKSAERLKKNEEEAAGLQATNPSDARAFGESALATEPIFITRLKCLLDIIREEYAN